jgi:hypothetical protein
MSDAAESSRRIEWESTDTTWPLPADTPKTRHYSGTFALIKGRVGASVDGELARACVVVFRVGRRGRRKERPRFCPWSYGLQWQFQIVDDIPVASGARNRPGERPERR